MKNIIEYYYNLRIDELHNKDDTYYFNINNNNFIFKPYTGNIERSYDIYKLNTILSNKFNIDNIILNKYNNLLTKINDNFYILTSNKKEKKLTLPLISNMALNNINIESLERNKWEVLWENKVDYYEMQLGENEKKYPLIRESFDYFVGLAENAISYLVNTKLELKPTINDQKVVSHNNIEISLNEPSNLILDHKARDIAEYIKYSFFNNNQNIFNELNEYFYHNYYSPYGIRVLFSRILYPSFYFNTYDKIISGKVEEKELNKIISKINNYEIYLYNIYLYLRKYYNIPSVDWLKKTRN